MHKYAWSTTIRRGIVSQARILPEYYRMMHTDSYQWLSGKLVRYSMRMSVWNKDPRMGRFPAVGRQLYDCMLLTCATWDTMDQWSVA